MAVLGNIVKIGPTHREDVGRVILVIAIAVGMHAILFQLFMFKFPLPKTHGDNFISVTLINEPPSKQTAEPINVLTEINGASLPINDVPSVPPLKTVVPPKAIALEASPEIKNTPQILISNHPAISTEIGNTVPLSRKGEAPSPIPRASSNVRMDEGLKALAAELSCLNGFNTDCAEIRKDVFKDFQMTQTDKVWTEKFAHTGLPSEFYGLSERQIRKKLGMHIAGENGVYIPFTNIGLDGAWWDSLHGIKKHCKIKLAAAPATSNMQGFAPVKVCPDSLASVRNKKNFIPKKKIE